MNQEEKKIVRKIMYRLKNNRDTEAMELISKYQRNLCLRSIKRIFKFCCENNEENIKTHNTYYYLKNISQHRHDLDPSADGDYGIIIASQCGHVELVKMLLEDSRVNIKNKMYSAIEEACKYGKKEVVELLMKDPRVDINDYQIIYAAFEEDQKEIVELIINNDKFDPSKENNNIFIKACISGYTEIVKKLLRDPRVNPCDQNNKAIICASEQENGIFEILMDDSRIDPSCEDGIVFENVCAVGNQYMVGKLLEDSRVDPSLNDNIGLYRAMKYNNVEVVNILLKDNRIKKALQEDIFSNEYMSMLLRVSMRKMSYHY